MYTRLYQTENVYGLSIQSLTPESSSARNGLPKQIVSVRHKNARRKHARILVVVTYSVRHPFFVGLLEREARSAGNAEYYWE